MPSINHETKIREIKDQHERQGFICKKPFPMYNPEEGNFSQIDLCCFKGEDSRCFEVEVAGKQVLKNSKDLDRFKSTFKNARTCQLGTKDSINSCSDFKDIADPEIKQNPQPAPNPKLNNPPRRIVFTNGL